MRLVFAKEAREDQNTEVKAERLMAATGHHLEDVIARKCRVDHTIEEEATFESPRHPALIPQLTN